MLSSICHSVKTLPPLRHQILGPKNGNMDPRLPSPVRPSRFRTPPAEYIIYDIPSLASVETVAVIGEAVCQSDPIPPGPRTRGTAGEPTVESEPQWGRIFPCSSPRAVVDGCELLRSDTHTRSNERRILR